MAHIPDDKVREVRERADLLDLVGRYVQLRRSGSSYKGLCPFHDEKTPSFNVSPLRKGFKCFGCGEGGDAISFLMKIEGKSFPEAVRKLADLYGVTLPAASSKEQARAEQARTERDRAHALLRFAADHYRELLERAPVGEAGRAYLATRGVGPEAAADFQLGYAPAPAEDGWDPLARALAAAGQDLELAATLGLISRNERGRGYHDRLRGRLVFPVLLPGGEVAGFSGRIVPPHDAPTPGPDGEAHAAPKYINSPESAVYRKGKILFGLPQARAAIRTRGRAILVEGNLDVVSLHQRGLAEAVAPLGTALTAEQVRLLARFTDQVVLCFDGDAAGRKAAAAALPMLLDGDLDARIVLLPDGQDPDSVDPERLLRDVEQARPALEVMMERLAARAGTSLEARARAVDRVLPLIVQHPRASARELYAQRAAELFGIPVPRLRQMARAHLRGAARAPSTSGQSVPPSAGVRPVTNLPPGQAQLAALLVRAPHLASLAERSGAREQVADPRLAGLVQAILAGARAGSELTLPELLEHVPAEHQEQVYRAVFEAPMEDGSDPEGLLRELLARCESDAVRARIEAIEREISLARTEGDHDRLRALVRERLALVATLDDLRQGHPRPDPAPHVPQGAADDPTSPPFPPDVPSG